MELNTTDTLAVEVFEVLFQARRWKEMTTEQELTPVLLMDVQVDAGLRAELTPLIEVALIVDARYSHHVGAAFVHGARRMVERETVVASPRLKENDHVLRRPEMARRGRVGTVRGMHEPDVRVGCGDGVGEGDGSSGTDPRCSAADTARIRTSCAVVGVHAEKVEVRASSRNACTPLMK
jgi:hypothetical protein